MTKTDILKFFRADPGESEFQVRKRVAVVLGLTPGAVHQWPERLTGRHWWIQATLELFTSGELVANVEDFYHGRPRARQAPRFMRVSA